MAMTTAFIDALHELEETGKVDVIVSLFRDDATFANPLVVHDATEEQSATRFWKTYRDSFSDIETEFVNLIESEEISVLEWRSDGVVDGQSVSYSGVSILEFDGDRIKAFRAYFDPRELVTKPAARDVDATPSDVESVH